EIREQRDCAHRRGGRAGQSRQTSCRQAVRGGEVIAANVVVIGAGKMGGSLLQGWIALGDDPARIVAMRPQPAASVEGLSLPGVPINPDPASICCDAIVIAVKPQIAAEIMPNVASLVSPSAVVISIMAGRTIGFLAGALPHNAAVVRAMPNTPAAIGRG